MVARLLHWLIAILIIAQVPLGLLMATPSDPMQKFKLFQLHKSLGITVLLLMAVRILWRFIARAPALPVSIPGYERFGAKAVHILLYILLFALPLTGWAIVSASKLPIPTLLYRTIPWPHIGWLASLPADEKAWWAAIFSECHETLSYVLIALVSLHIAAALRHGIIIQDGVLSRMLPKIGRRPSTSAIATALAIGGALMMFAAPSVRAAEWSIDPQKSSVGFEATAGGYTTKGAFGQYRSEIEFDPGEPQQTSIRVSLNMRSVTTGMADIDTTLQSPDYFDPAKFPTAEFTARGATPLSDGKYLLEGRLTLKGVTKPVKIPFTIDIKSGTATVKAEAKINRLDFGVGPESAGSLLIDKDVKLTIDLAALRLDN
jgi:cytochrome b561/polyisoprenoid-binding protein YceI